LIHADRERAEEILDSLLGGEGQGQPADPESRDQAGDGIAEQGEHGNHPDHEHEDLGRPRAEGNERSRCGHPTGPRRTDDETTGHLDDPPQRPEQRQQQEGAHEAVDTERDAGGKICDRNERRGCQGRHRQRDRWSQPLHQLVIPRGRGATRGDRNEPANEPAREPSDHGADGHDRRQRDPLPCREPERTTAHQPSGQLLESADARERAEHETDHRERRYMGAHI
jgi:hypothetical protein